MEDLPSFDNSLSNSSDKSNGFWILKNGEKLNSEQKYENLGAPFLCKKSGKNFRTRNFAWFSSKHQILVQNPTEMLKIPWSCLYLLKYLSTHFLFLLLPIWHRSEVLNSSILMVVKSNSFFDSFWSIFAHFRCFMSLFGNFFYDFCGYKFIYTF